MVVRNELETYISKKEGYIIACSLCSASWYERDEIKVNK